ncbi:mucosal addressin cell adhesion molecule 1 [Lepus europaeus]|uniref:mucosal addressin cell adhesion molecule 1 n=1 Tax=Lepus europaeus TaxID=9983 RepID=UPI002B47DA5B|nr:mucosal addressin cell adhesion molecule 1 [Lepus europaeus]
MGPSAALLLAGSLGLLRAGVGQPLRVEPPDPVVTVAVGTSRRFTCSLACAGGAAADVRWRGLDTSLGAVQSVVGRSTLTVHHASPAATGTHVCVGSCGDLTFQRTVRLVVYAFPDELTVSPPALVPGRDLQVACTAHNVTPWHPDALSFSLLAEGQELEGAETLGWEEEEEELLFHVTERWLLPALGTPAPRALRCQATMRLPGLELSRARDIPVLHGQTTLKTPGPTSPEPRDPGPQEPPNQTSREPPHPISSKPLDPYSPNPTPQKPPNQTTSQEPPDPISPKPPGPYSPNPTPQKPPDLTTWEPPDTASPAGTCHPKILQAPRPSAAKGARLELLCEVACGPGVAVRWTLAPGGLAAYERTEAGARAWLRVPLTRDSPEGWFQCRVEPGGQVASLYVRGRQEGECPPSGVERAAREVAAGALPLTRATLRAGELRALSFVAAEPARPPLALWTGGLALALLLLLAALAGHLRRRCHRPAPR